MSAKDNDKTTYTTTTQRAQRAHRIHRSIKSYFVIVGHHHDSYNEILGRISSDWSIHHFFCGPALECRDTHLINQSNNKPINQSTNHNSSFAPTFPSILSHILTFLRLVHPSFLLFASTRMPRHLNFSVISGLTWQRRTSQ